MAVKLEQSNTMWKQHTTKPSTTVIYAQM